MVAGAYDHTIQMQAKGQPIVAMVRSAVSPASCWRCASEGGELQGPADLKGMKIGVTAPGSSTHFMALHMMAQAGSSPMTPHSSASARHTAVAAVKRGEIDGIVNVDPVIALLERKGPIKVGPTRARLKAPRKMYRRALSGGGDLRDARHCREEPELRAGLVNAFVRGLKWVQSHSPEEIAKVMPEEFALGNKALYVQSIKTNLPIFSPDGRFSKDGPETASGAQGVRS